MKLTLQYYPHDGDTPTATACVESDGHLEELFDGNLEWFFDDAMGADVEPGQVTIESGEHWLEGLCYLDEHEVIAMMLYSLAVTDYFGKAKTDAGTNGKYIDVKGFDLTVSLNGDVYTDIKRYGLISNQIGYTGAWFEAKKNGGESSEYYLLTKSVLSSQAEFEGCIIRRSPSYGIVETGSELRYAGSLLQYEGGGSSAPKQHYVWSRKDTDGNLIVGGIDEDAIYLEEDIFAVYDEKQTVSTIHLFFEQDGADYAFSLLMNGKLHRRFSKTDDAVTYYHFTRFRIEYGSKEIVFRNADGSYLIDEHWLANSNTISKGVHTVLAVPQAPVVGNVTAERLQTLYQNCVKALYEAFEHSEAYYTTKYQWAIEEHVEEWSKETENRLATENPPDCQISIERTKNGRYAFSWEDAEITLRDPKVNGITKGFYNLFVVPFPRFSVECIAFKGSPVALKPKNGILTVSITDAETGRVYEGGFEQLRLNPDFDSAGIPSNLHIEPDWIEVMSLFGRYRQIKDAIEQFGIDRCQFLFEDDDPVKIREVVTGILYGEPGMIPDDNVVSAAGQLKNRFEREEKIPNIAIVGQAGTGKTTLVRNLGRLFGKSVLSVSSSDLIGAYIGHTKYQLVQVLAEAAIKKQILYVDEAYQLMEDKFGHEAIANLLPLMTGDRTDIEAGLDKGQMDTLRLDFAAGQFQRISASGAVKESKKFPPGNIPIWISGYENDIRKMISQNQGLYRRLDKIVIKTPTASDLLNQLDRELEELASGSDKAARKAEKLQKHFRDGAEKKDGSRESVKQFFVWGSAPQNSKYFASHAGVSKFVENCIDAVDFGMPLGPQIEEIISSTKIDIKRQLAAVKSGSGDGQNHNAPDAIDTINVITDIDTRFTDLVGCDSQIAYMKNIIDMLVKKGIYEDCRLNVPKGALMEGLPGTGKTFIARAMAGELQERFQQNALDKRFGFMAFSAAELASKPLSYLANIFSTAEEYDACVMFLDEIDAIARHRSNNPAYGHYLELIKQMDGIEKRSNVFILAATNAPENLNPAFVRSGRIDKRFRFTLPNREARETLAGRAIRKRVGKLDNFDPEGKEDDIASMAKWLAGKMPYCTAGDIDNVINLAFIVYRQFTHRNDPDSFTDKDFFRSYPCVKQGQDGRLEIASAKYKNITNDTALKELCAFLDEEIERMRMGDPDYKKKEKKFSTDKNGTCSSTAVHEVGHAVVSLMLGEKPFETITVIPRGDALGYVSHSELELVTKADYEKRIRVSMGGRIAEELTYGKDNISSGARGDMISATYYARRMTEQWGFSDEFGFMALAQSGGNYLGVSSSYICSDAFRDEIDRTVRELLKRLYQQTLEMLQDKGELIKRLAKIVYDRESMTGEEFRRHYNKQMELLAKQDRSEPAKQQ